MSDGMQFSTPLTGWAMGGTARAWAELMRRLRPADRDVLLAEAAQWCAFAAPQANYDIFLGRP